PSWARPKRWPWHNYVWGLGRLSLKPIYATKPFDALRPRHVHVRVTTYWNVRSPRKMLDVVTSDGRQLDKPRVRAWSLLNVSYEECLPEVWNHIEERLTELFGGDCWDVFKKSYQAAFFASNPIDGFFVRYRYDDPAMEILRAPPPSLAELLPGFEIPKLQLDLVRPQHDVERAAASEQFLHQCGR
ncbi:hypothetical protein, partial [Comamonas odontotermitis]